VGVEGAQEPLGLPRPVGAKALVHPLGDLVDKIRFQAFRLPRHGLPLSCYTFIAA
jgi:hypothetical protein